MVKGRISHNATLDDRLFSLLAIMEDDFGINLEYTDTARTIKEHIELYKRLEKDNRLEEGKRWYEVIAWGSRHLPNWSGTLKGVDIKGKGCCSDIYLSGDELAELLITASKILGLNIGLGIGLEFCHIDVRSYTPKPWRYKY